MADVKFTAGLQNACLNGLAAAMANGVLHVYSAPKPVSPDKEEGLATLLAILSLNGETFTPGDPTNGFNVELSGSTLVKAIDPITTVEEVVSGIGITSGTAAWARWYDNNRVQGESTSAVRLDGTVSTSTAATFTLSNLSVIAGDPIFLKSVNIISAHR